MKARNPALRLRSRMPGLQLAFSLMLAATLFACSSVTPNLTSATRASDAGPQRPSGQARKTANQASQRPSYASASQEQRVQHNGKSGAVGKQNVNSRIAKAAHSQIIGEPLPEVLAHSPIVQAACGFEPGCGIEAACGAEAVCGAEIVCGAEPYCGVEPTCGACDGSGMCDSCGHNFVQESAVYCGPGCDTIGCTGCDAMGHNGFYPVHAAPMFLPVFRIDWRQFEFFLGTQAFSGPMNFAGNGATALENDGTASFGIQEGFNYAAPSYIFGRALSWQLGLRALQSNASGAEFTSDSRSQVFLTAGLFRRVDYGFQGGVVVDYMNDDWYYSVDMLQIRGQLSWMLDPRHEFGYGFMSSQDGGNSTGTIRLDDGTNATVNVNFEPLDQHRFFYRWHFRNTGTFELFAGFTGEKDGLLGLSTEIPLIDGLGLRTGFTYLNPDIAAGEVDNQEESWNMGLSFVWYPCGSKARRSYDRPMFDVADNGLMLIQTP